MDLLSQKFVKTDSDKKELFFFFKKNPVLEKRGN